MRVVNTELGKVVLLFNPEDFRPRGGVHSPSAFSMIKERYAFGYSPDLRLPWDKVQKDGFKFQLGKLVIGGKQINISEFTVYNDGIVASAFNTEDAELFLKDIFEWGKDTLGMSDPTKKARRLYQSHVVIEFDHSINVLVQGYNELSDKLSSCIKQTYGIEEPMQLSGLGFNCDRTNVPSWLNFASFMIERRINQPYETNRFISEAPLTTQTHLDCLGTLEAVAAASKPTKKPK